MYILPCRAHKWRWTSCWQSRAQRSGSRRRSSSSSGGLGKLIRNWTTHELAQREKKKINSSNYRYRSREARCRPGGGTRAWPLKKQIFIKIKICWEMFVFRRFNSPGPLPPRCPRRARSKRPWSRRRWSGAGPAGGPGSLRKKEKRNLKKYFCVRESTFFGGVPFSFLATNIFP